MPHDVGIAGKRNTRVFTFKVTGSLVDPRTKMDLID